ncbi:Putative DNA-binding protein Ner [Avibacterium paragallinarum JF4211]|nr:Putative DNA-binding protein Ner [Avibacterium paragallinarum JF4211]
MQRADIRYELMKKGISLSQLGVKHGLAKTTLRNVFDKRYPNGERIIAEALGMKPCEIWPSRYQKNS